MKITIEDIYIELEPLFDENESGYTRRLAVYLKLNEMLPNWEGNKQLTKVKALHNKGVIVQDLVKYHRKLLIDFFKYFRDNGENNIGMTIEDFVDGFIKSL